MAAKLTAQRNDLILSEAIFGVDVTVVEIKPRKEFSTSFANLPSIAIETHKQCAINERQIDRIITKEEMAYYSVGLLWMRLIDIKAKQAKEALTTEEKSIRKVMEDIEFNVPQPISAYLNQVGTYKDALGKTTNLTVPELPIQKVQGLGGYHSRQIDLDSHNLFKEVPSLGVSGDTDLVMALCQDTKEPKPNVHVIVNFFP